MLILSPLRLLLPLLILAIGVPFLAQTPAATPEAKATESPALLATATALASLQKEEHNLLWRPIAQEAGKVHWADRTYPYGGTQWGARPVHLGVEFVNPRHTPVLAAAAGKVVFAGSDSETMLGPKLDYYGDVVVLAHDLQSLDGLPVFSLYAHLESIAVQAGQEAEAGAEIGTVGSSGVALGAHLHFEVRVADPFDHRMTRNPDLWLRHYPRRGMIAGMIADASGNPIMEKRIVARSDNLRRETHTYGGTEVNSDAVWRENFTIPDLPAGDYQLVTLKENGAIAFREWITVTAYATSFVHIVIAD